MVVVDDLGYGDLGCYGGTVADTPHPDRMAREGEQYDLSADPADAKDLAGGKPDVARRLTTAALGWRKSVP